MLAWVNGKPSKTLSIYDRGLAYGDGFFETILIKENRPSLLNFHLERILEACRELSIPFDASAFVDELNRFSQLSSESRAVVKLIVTRGSGGRGYSAAQHSKPVRILTLHPTNAPAWQDDKPAIRTNISSIVLSNQPRLAGLKHLNKLEQVLARQEVDSQKQWDDALLLDSKGHVIEATAANLYLVKEGRVITPKLDLCGVNGCVRRLVLQRLAHDLKISVIEKQVVLSELKNADELFLTNSIAGVIPVKQVGLWHYERRKWSNKIGSWVESQL